MTRSILASLAAAVAVAVVSGTGCNSTGVGDPCTPEAEYSQAFLGFDVKEVNVESKSFQCETRLCLANHFQGRVTCPYGQNSGGTAAFGLSSPSNGQGTPCETPIDQPVNGIDTSLSPPAVDDPKVGATVQPNCTDRTAEHAVYCSCRCQNVDGKTDDGANYCTCPTGFSCTQLVSSVGNTETGLTGGYCIKNGTAFDPNNSCGSTCDATSGGCGKAQGVPN
ncbi:MAG TPA: hypothetical protein VGG39_12825 [Polyangiaceae bacterium]|jgi:hypothetical protein